MRRLPTQHAAAFHHADGPLPRRDLEFSDRGNGQAPVARCGHDGFAEGMFAHLFERRGGRQHRELVPCPERPQVGDRRASRGNGAGLVEHHDIEFRGALQDVAALEQHAALRAAAGGHHDGSGHRQSHGAGTGDDEDGHRGGEGADDAWIRSDEEPDGEGDEGDNDDHRHKDRGDPVGQLLDRRLGALGLAHHPDDLGKHGVAARRGWRGSGWHRRG